MEALCAMGVGRGAARMELAANGLTLLRARLTAQQFIPVRRSPPPACSGSRRHRLLESAPHQFLDALKEGVHPSTAMWTGGSVVAHDVAVDDVTTNVVSPANHSADVEPGRAVNSEKPAGTEAHAEAELAFASIEVVQK